MQADFLYDEKSITHHREVWGGLLSKSRYVVICFNRFEIETVFSLDFSKMFPGKKVASIRDVIDKKNESMPKGNTFTTKIVGSHAVAMYVLGLDAALQTE